MGKHKAQVASKLKQETQTHNENGNLTEPNMILLIFPSYSRKKNKDMCKRLTYLVILVGYYKIAKEDLIYCNLRKHIKIDKTSAN